MIYIISLFNLNINNTRKSIHLNNKFFFNMGMGDWGLGIGDWARP